MKKHPATAAIHAGEFEHHKPSTSSVPPINMSTTFLVDPETPFSANLLEEDAPFIYTRWGNPTLKLLEEKVASLEGGEAGLVFSSGIAAVTSLMNYKLKSGERVLVSDIAYAGVREFGNHYLKKMQIEVVPVNMSDLDAVETELQRGAKLVFAETPCNPIVRLTDLREVAKLSHQYGAVLAVDSTFASPMATRPLELGADYVIHSLTKYMGGHGDAIGGAVVGSKAEMDKLRATVLIHQGAIMSPFNAWLINRGLVTLPLRMKQHSENALQLAAFLQDHPNTKQVIYPGLLSHPQYELALRQMDLFSGMLTLQVDNPVKVLARINEHLKTVHYAVSLGHHKTLMYYMDTEALNESSFQMSSTQMEDYRRYAGDGIFRISVGLEFIEDIIEDFRQLLD